MSAPRRDCFETATAVTLQQSRSPPRHGIELSDRCKMYQDERPEAKFDGSKRPRPQDNESFAIGSAETRKPRADPQNTSRACESCRLSKSRCILPSESLFSGQCQRCAKFNRACIFTQRTRTRKSGKTAARVRELERKLEVLASVLEKRSAIYRSAAGDQGVGMEAKGSLVEGSQYLVPAVDLENDVVMQDSMLYEKQQIKTDTVESRNREVSESKQKRNSRSRSSVFEDAMNPMFASATSNTVIQNTPWSSIVGIEPNNQLLPSTELNIQSQSGMPRPSSVSDVPSSLPLSRSRRSHTKSKLGCKTCKTRKIKCDENRPRCFRCQERGLTCDYVSQGLVSTIRTQKPRTASPWSSACFSSICARSAASQIQQVLEPDLAYELESHALALASQTSGLLETLQHFESVAFSTIGSPLIQNAMRKNGLLLAQDAPFLFHTLFAYSAHHLSHLKPQHLCHRTAAIHHKTRGLKLYAKELGGNIGRHNMDSIFATCMLFAILAYLPASEDDLDPSHSWLFSDQPEAMSWLLMQFGFLTLKRTSGLQEHLASSIWLPVFLDSDVWFAGIVCRTGIEGLPLAFVELCGIDESSTAENNSYHSALRLLVGIMQAEDGIPSFLKLICFPGRMRSEFFDLLRGKDAVALLIVGYWLSEMCKINQWWCVPRVKSECLAICSYLDGWPDSRIQDLLQIPMQACGYVAADPSAIGL